jgi:hypothetical protein
MILARVSGKQLFLVDSFLRAFASSQHHTKRRLHAYTGRKRRPSSTIHSGDSATAPLSVWLRAVPRTRTTINSAGARAVAHPVPHRTYGRVVRIGLDYRVTRLCGLCASRAADASKKREQDAVSLC